MFSISLPKSPIYKELDEKSGQLIIEECFPRYGATLGNSLRRVLLSSLEGNAIVSAKIKGVTHEFSAIDGIVEDVVQIILNLKAVRFKLEGVDEATAFLKVKGKKKVTAKDFETTSELEVVTPDAHIATITNSGTTLDLEIKVKKGLGYVPVEQRDDEKEIGTIAVDAIYNPVKRVNFTVENMRVGKRTDYERVILDIVTDGSISPQEAYQKAVEILMSQFNAIATIGEEDDVKKEEVAKSADKKEEDKQEEESVKDDSVQEQVAKTVADLNLPTRTLSVLEDNKITTIKQIEKMTEDDLLNLEGMGEKGVKEIRKAIGALGIILKAKE